MKMGLQTLSSLKGGNDSDHWWRGEAVYQEQWHRERIAGGMSRQDAQTNLQPEMPDSWGIQCKE